MDTTEEEEIAQLAGLANIEIGRRKKRPTCSICCRPVGVCWCQSLSGSKISTKCKVILLQHPHEEKRSLRTAPILQALMPKGHYLELKGKKFSLTRFPQLQDIVQNENTIVLYPGKSAFHLEELPSVQNSPSPYNIIILDGTWQQAKSMFHKSPLLKKLKQVQLTGQHISQYIIRTQPTEDALSTVETAAISMSMLERNWSIYSLLINPLQLICQFQINHGAVEHHSKEHLILTGKYRKPLGKKTYKKLRSCGAKNDNITVQELLDIAQRQEASERDEAGQLELSGLRNLFVSDEENDNDVNETFDSYNNNNNNNSDAEGDRGSRWQDA